MTNQFILLQSIDKIYNDDTFILLKLIKFPQSQTIWKNVTEKISIGFRGIKTVS